jgi:N-acetylmuramoyl-L-alanine amidase
MIIMGRRRQMKKWKKKALALTLAAVIVLLALTANAAAAARIVIDPGHGGQDPGAIGINGLYEKTVNLDISLKVRDLLTERGYEVLMTREDDTGMDLQERVEFKERHNADLFVSIHANANRSRSVQGTMVLYYDDRYPQSRYPASPEMASLSQVNRRFAQIMLDEILRTARTQNRGIVPSAVYVARMGTMPSVLVETAFLSNGQDAARLADESFREAMALGIANGIERFLPLGGFMDIEGHWASDAILRMKEEGVVQGYRSLYHPDRPLSRAEFIAMADRMFHLSADDGPGSNGEQDPTGSTEQGTADPEIPAEPAVQADPVDQDPGGTVEPEPERVDEHGLPGATGPEDPAYISEQDPQGTSANEDDSTGVSGQDTDVVFFTDLSEDHWAYEILVKAAKSGYVQGYPDGTIRPEAPITRAEVSALFDRVWNVETEQGPSVPAADSWPFADVPPDSWYAVSVLRLKSAGLMLGTAPRQFAPERKMTRAEAAVLFDRYISASNRLAQTEEPARTANPA